MSDELYRLFMMNYDMPEGGLNDLYGTYLSLSDAEKAMHEYDEDHFNEAHISQGFIILKSYKLKDNKWKEYKEKFYD
jgi:hypothetical protein